MEKINQRRSFLKQIALGGLGAAVVPGELLANNIEGATKEKALTKKNKRVKQERRQFNAPYEGDFLNRVAFPIGGIGAGMYCLEGTGAISHMSVRHRPEIFHEPSMFAAVAIKGETTKAKVVEGPVSRRMQHPRV